MKKQLQVGLVAEGNVTSSAVLRLASLADTLGPIKSSGLQVARRISNFLRAGYAVAEYHELQAARFVLLRIPDSAAQRVVEELCRAELVFEELSFVLCESWLPTETLEPLRGRGAAIASLMEGPSGKGKCFVLEGDLVAVRQIRRILERGDGRTVELRPGTKSLYFAANLLVAALPVPLLVAAQRALRESGVSGKQLSRLLEDMAREMVDSFLRGARITWGGPLTSSTEATVEEYFRQLNRDAPGLAAMVSEQLAWARRQVEKRPQSHTVVV
jgi:predicted short-subunit dehydrogenase-like oxidoreductase (DUF2520 family)